MCHAYHRGGVTRWMADAAIAYSERGWDVYFLSVNPTTTFFSGKGRETLLEMVKKNENSVKVISKNVGREFEFGTGKYRISIYAGLLKQLPPSTPVIISDDGQVWEAGGLYNDILPVIGVLHADEEHYYQKAEQHVKNISAFVCVSKRVERLVSKRLPEVGNKDICTIPCGINLPDMNRAEDATDAIQLIFVGRVSDYQKRVQDLVNIAMRLKKENVAFHLNIIGDGTDKERLEMLVSSSGLANDVTFHGWVSQREVAAFLAKSDILVLTSDFEGTPIAMMEALAAGCGMVGTRVSGIEDYEFHQEAAECFAINDVGDIEAAVKNIIKIAAVPANKRSMAARRLAEQEFRMDVCLDRYERVIDKLSAQSSVFPPDVKFSVADLVYSRILAIMRQAKLKLSGLSG